MSDTSAILSNSEIDQSPASTQEKDQIFIRSSKTKDSCYMKVILTKYRKVSEFSESFVVFRIITDTTRSEFPGNHCEVERRYSDSEWLHRKLDQSYPAMFVPPLPGKQLASTLDRFDAEFLQQRASRLQVFLDRIASHPVLSSDENVIIFLSSLSKEFSEFKQTHACGGLFSSLFSNRVQIIDPSISSTSADTDSLQILRLHLTENLSAEFRAYADEASEFVDFARTVVRTTERIAASLSGLQLGMQELSHHLHCWPPRLVLEDADNALAQLERELTNDHLDKKCDQTTTEQQQQRQICIDWSRTRAVGPKEVGRGFELVSRLTKGLCEQIRSTVLNQWSEQASYGDMVCSVLNRRDELERYTDTVNRLNSTQIQKSNTSKGFLAAFTRDNAPWRNRALPDLVQRAKQLQDSLAFGNSQIRAEFVRWQSERGDLMRRHLLQMAQLYTAYWEQVCQIWQDVIASVHNKPATNTETQ